ncbi:MAG: hypothetical protein ACK4MJ_03940, partial [Hylemonella sp.]
VRRQAVRHRLHEGAVMIDDETLRRWGREFDRDEQAVRESYPNTFYDGEQDALRRLAQKISGEISRQIESDGGFEAWRASQQARAEAAASVTGG